MLTSTTQLGVCEIFVTNLESRYAFIVQIVWTLSVSEKYMYLPIYNFMSRFSTPELQLKSRNQSEISDNHFMEAQ